jgi:hypothetical protein
MRVAFITFTLLVLSGNADACPGVFANYTTLLRDLHRDASAHPVVAKVEVLELLPYQHPSSGRTAFHNRARVRVVSALKGIAEDAIVTLDSDCSSCGGCLEQSHVGNQWFVAGEMQGPLLRASRWYFTRHPSGGPPRQTL